MEILNENYKPLRVDKKRFGLGDFCPVLDGLPDGSASATYEEHLQAIGEIRGEEGELGRRD